jgi:RNA polymerase sigma-70 factor (ECF subfamily)
MGKAQFISLEDAEPLTCDPGVDPLRMLEADQVRAMIKELPVKMREVIVLRMYHDLDDREIASAVGCPLGTVKTRYHRALKILEKKWELRSRR